jgi:hypothetical protein
MIKKIYLLTVLAIIYGCQVESRQEVILSFLNEYVNSDEYKLIGFPQRGILEIPKKQILPDLPNSKERLDDLNIFLLRKNDFVSVLTTDSIGDNGARFQIKKIDVEVSGQKWLIKEDSKYLYFKLFDFKSLHIKSIKKIGDTLIVDTSHSGLIKTPIYEALDTKLKAYLEKDKRRRFALLERGNSFKVIQFYWED